MLIRRLIGYGSDDSREDCDLKKDLACCESESDVWGDELVGGSRREVDIVYVY